jgi:hypothetical protein
VKPGELRRRGWKALLVALALLSGCTAIQVGYNNADNLIHWRGGRYFGFEAEQKADFERRVQRFLAWHRKTELPKYALFANGLADRLARGLSQADLVWGYDSFQALLRQSLGAGAAESGELLDGLSAAQIERFEARLARENRDHAKEYGLSDPPEERRARRTKRNIERLEDWFGSLTDAQVARVRRYSERAPLDDELRDRDRKRMQRELVAMLRARQAQQRLVPWALAWDQNRDPAYEAQRLANLKEYFGMVLDLDKTLSVEQRGRAVKRLRDFAGDFSSLVAVAVAAP